MEDEDVPWRDADSVDEYAFGGISPGSVFDDFIDEGLKKKKIMGLFRCVIE